MPENISRFGSRVSGARTTFTINQDRRVPDFLPQIALLQPSEYPLVTLTSRLGSTPVINRKYQWLEDNLSSDMTTAAAAASSTATSVTLTDANMFQQYDLLLVSRTGDIMLVTAVTSSTVAAVSRFPGSSDIQSGDEIIIIRGGAWPESTGSPTALTMQTVTRTNQCQIMKNSLEFSADDELQQFYGGSDMEYQVRKKAIEHAIAIEWAYWFSRGSTNFTGATSSGYVYTMSGVREQLESSSNVNRLDGISLSSLDGAVLDSFCENLFRYKVTDTRVKVLFCAPAIATRISQIAKDTTPGGGSGGLQMRPEDDTYGIVINSYRSPHGILDIVPHWLFKDSVIFNKVGYVLDMAAVRARHMRPTTYQDNIQNPDTDGTKGQYLSELSIMVQFPEVHGIIELQSLS